MSWLKNLLGGDSTLEVAIEAETDEGSLQRGVFALDGYASTKGFEETREKEFYCGICGWSPISTFPHSH